MTKEQKRGNREVRKPKQTKAPPSAPGQAPAKGSPFIPQAPKKNR